MKILICSKLFYPSNAIGAVRPSNFAKYLSEFGHEITVIAAETQDKEVEGFQGIEIIRISNSKTIRRLMHRTQNYVNAKNAIKKFDEDFQSENNQDDNKRPIFLNIKQFYRTSRRQIYNLLIEIDWYIRAKRSVKSRYIKNSFDIVISSFGPVGSYLLGYFVSKSKFANHWISDLRDNIPDTRYPFWLNIVYKAVEKKMILNADAIILVSYGQASMLVKSLKDVSFDRNKIYVIYNGYENKFKPLPYEKKDKILRISYTGQLYSKLSNFELLFKVLNDLIEEQLIDLDKIVFYYVGQNSVRFKTQVSRYDKVMKICKNLGLVNRKTALEIQDFSDILIVLAWNTNTRQGVLTGKFMEYLQAYKPIISLTSGNLPNGELSQMIEKLSLGLACEYITYEKDYDRLREYLLTQYNRIQEGKPLLFDPDIEGMKKFHYEKLTGELNDICLSIRKNSKYNTGEG